MQTDTVYEAIFDEYKIVCEISNYTYQVYSQHFIV